MTFELFVKASLEVPRVSNLSWIYHQSSKLISKSFGPNETIRPTNAFLAHLNSEEFLEFLEF